MKNLAVSADHNPQEVSPEGVQIANTFLELGCDIEKTSEMLEIPGYEINNIISSKAVQAYIVQALTDASINSMDKITESMNDIIDNKLQEMQELEMTSAKDIADLLQIAHKMQVDKTKIVQAKTPKESKIPTNQQVNIFNADDNSSYNRLMQAIIEG